MSNVSFTDAQIIL